MAKNLDHQFLLLVEKIEDSYQILSNILKKIWKLIRIVRNIVSDLFAKLQLHIVINKKKDKYHINRLQAIDKYWGKVHYKHFYQIDKVIGLTNSFIVLELLFDNTKILIRSFLFG